MKVYPFASYLCFLFVGPPGLLLSTAGRVAACEPPTASSEITLEQAQRIWQVESLITKYRTAADQSGRLSAVEELKEIYSGSRGSFLEVVVINGLLDLDELGVLRQEGSGSANTFLEFAGSLAAGASSSRRNLSNREDAGLRQFLESWLIFRDGTDAIDAEVASHRRIALVDKASSRVAGEIIGMPCEDRITRLFRGLKEWDTPYEYEACITLLGKEYEMAPELVLQQIKALVRSGLPQSVPPPYTREHTIVHIVCMLGKALNDASLIELFEEMEKSENPYVSRRAAETLLWLRNGVRFPLKYNELWRSYQSRS